MAQQSTALAKVGGPVALAMQGFLEQSGLTKETCNLLMPVAYIDRLPAMSRLSVRAVQADPEPGRGDVYKSTVFMKPNEVAPTKVLLDKIAAAAGISWVYSHRVDDRSDPYYVEWEACGEMVGFDGTPTRYQRTRVVDLRERSPVAWIAVTRRQTLWRRRDLDRYLESKAVWGTR